MIKAFITLYFCSTLLQVKLVSNEINDFQPATLKALDSHQLLLEEIVTSRGKYNYDGVNFYDSVTKKKMDDDEAAQLKKKIQNNIDIGIQQMKEAQSQLKQAEHQIFQAQQNLNNKNL